MARGGKRQNSGRKKGKKDAETIEREKVLDQLRDKIAGVADKLFASQFIVAHGTHRMVIITKHEGGLPTMETVKDQDQMDELIANGEYGKDYHILTGHGPNNQAIDSMFNRAFGKPKETVELQGIEFSFDEEDS